MRYRLYRLLKTIYALLFAVRRTPWLSVVRLIDQSSEYVVWLWPNRSYLTGDILIWELATIGALINQGAKFSIVIGNRIDVVHGKTIFWNPHPRIVSYRDRRYTEALVERARRIEKRGNQLYPRSGEVEYWENKAFMHERFEALGIRTPRTVLARTVDALYEEMSLPFLVKETHNCSSQGLYKISSWEQLRKLIDERYLQENEWIVAQELLDIRRDFRVTLVGDKIVLHYWRVNPEAEWRPTSTSHGSKVDFETFPDLWRNEIVNAFKKLELTTGAFDVAWQHDDLTSPPYFLEVSPIYQPNPPVSLDDRGITYGDYKKGFSLRDPYERGYVEVIWQIKQEVVDECIRLNERVKRACDQTPSPKSASSSASPS